MMRAGLLLRLRINRDFSVSITCISFRYRDLQSTKRVAVLQGSCTGAGVSRPINPPRRHRRRFPLEGLSAPRQGEGHDPRRRRVHPRLPAADLARRLPSHSAPRLPRQRPSLSQAGTLSQAARCAATRTARRVGEDTVPSREPKRCPCCGGAMVVLHILPRLTHRRPSFWDGSS